LQAQYTGYLKYYERISPWKISAVATLTHHNTLSRQRRIAWTKLHQTHRHPWTAYTLSLTAHRSLRLRGGGSWCGGGYRSSSRWRRCGDCSCSRRSSLRWRTAGIGCSRQLSRRRVTNLRRSCRRLRAAAPRTSTRSTLRAPRRSRRVRHARLRSSTDGDSSIASATLSFDHHVHV
jgi:hypothetical protein